MNPRAMALLSVLVLVAIVLLLAVAPRCVNFELWMTSVGL